VLNFFAFDDSYCEDSSEDDLLRVSEIVGRTARSDVLVVLSRRRLPRTLFPLFWSGIVIFKSRGNVVASVDIVRLQFRSSGILVNVLGKSNRLGWREVLHDFASLRLVRCLSLSQLQISSETLT
jgi:hypothetical protein